MEKIIYDLLSYRGSLESDYESANSSEGEEPQAAAAAQPESNTVESILNDYMRHFESQVFDKLRSIVDVVYPSMDDTSVLAVKFVPDQPEGFFYENEEEGDEEPVYRPARIRQRRPFIAAHYEPTKILSNGRYYNITSDTYHQIIKKGFFASRMKDFVIHAAAISIRIEIVIEMPDTEIPTKVPDDSNVTLRLDLLTRSNGIFVEETRISFETFKDSVQDHIISAISGITEVYIRSERGLNMSMFRTTT